VNPASSCSYSCSIWAAVDGWVAGYVASCSGWLLCGVSCWTELYCHIASLCGDVPAAGMPPCLLQHVCIGGCCIHTLSAVLWSLHDQTPCSNKIDSTVADVC
jgi:hypothetical protein